MKPVTNTDTMAFTRPPELRFGVDCMSVVQHLAVTNQVESQVMRRVVDRGNGSSQDVEGRHAWKRMAHERK